MACTTKITIGKHRRCFCNGKLAPNSACGLGRKSGSKKRKSSKKSAAGTCVPGTARYIRGGSCACRTKGGGFSTISKSICKRKYAKKK